MSTLDKTALYYPEIAIPSGGWIRQALLYFDSIASIVPASIQLWTARQLELFAKRGEPVPASIATISNDLDLLTKEKQYRPISPDGFIEIDSFERSIFQDEFLSNLLSNSFQRGLGVKAAWIFDAGVHINKMPPDLLDLLIGEGYAERTDDPDWFNLERSTALLYMSLLAKYLARADYYDTVPCTSGAHSAYNDVVFREDKTIGAAAVAGVLFKNILPCPAEHTPLNEIMRFKEKRKSELRAFRSRVADLERDISTAHSIEEIKSVVQRFGEERDSALEDLNTSFWEQFRDGALQSSRALIRLSSPTVWLTGAAIANHLTATTQLAPATTAIGLATVGTIEVGVLSITGAIQRRQTFKDSAFSYVYYTERELGRRTRPK
jgi:hypothetical protein